ncbi:MAG: hypothetical protein IBX71_08420 [Candidatus Desulforudis sp.]|nr:hypothetical protein [Desulforudis sp.]
MIEGGRIIFDLTGKEGVMFDEGGAALSHSVWAEVSGAQDQKFNVGPVPVSKNADFISLILDYLAGESPPSGVTAETILSNSGAILTLKAGGRETVYELVAEPTA